MKKLLLFTVASATMLASCSKNDVQDINKNAPGTISFGKSYVGTTKAADMDLAALKAVTGGFYVNAYETDDEIAKPATTFKLHMPKVLVTRDGGDTKWEYPGTYYWPKNPAKVQFYAWDKASDGAVTFTDPVSATAYATLDYVSPTVANQTDLVVASKYDLGADATNASAPGVDMNFYHALTKVNFAARSEVPGTYVKITNITLKAVNHKGTFTFKATGKGTWTTVATDAADIVYPLGAGETISGATTSAGSALASYAIGTSFTSVMKADGALMLLPSNAASITVEVTYESYDASTHAAIDASATKSFTITDAATVWKPSANIRYNMMLPVTSSSLPIVFETITLDSWDAETGTVVNPS